MPEVIATEREVEPEPPKPPKHDFTAKGGHNVRGDGKITKCPPSCPAFPSTVVDWP